MKSLKYIQFVCILKLRNLQFKIEESLREWNLKVHLKHCDFIKSPVLSELRNCRFCGGIQM